jgi:uncharacterized membrane protein YedE/YeeE
MYLFGVPAAVLVYQLLPGCSCYLPLLAMIYVGVLAVFDGAQRADIAVEDDKRQDLLMQAMEFLLLSGFLAFTLLLTVALWKQPPQSAVIQVIGWTTAGVQWYVMGAAFTASFLERTAET